MSGTGASPFGPHTVILVLEAPQLPLTNYSGHGFSKMEPTITFQCTNENCAEYSREIEVSYRALFDDGDEYPNEDWCIIKLKSCPCCSAKGELHIRHGDRTFSEIDAFTQYAVGLAKEAKLLKKLDEKGVAEPEDKRQHEKALRLLQDLKCPCCKSDLVQLAENQTEGEPPDKDE